MTGGSRLIRIGSPKVADPPTPPGEDPVVSQFLQWVSRASRTWQSGRRPEYRECLPHVARVYRAGHWSADAAYVVARYKIGLVSQNARSIANGFTNMWKEYFYWSRMGADRRVWAYLDELSDELCDADYPTLLEAFRGLAKAIDRLSEEDRLDLLSGDPPEGGQ